MIYTWKAQVKLKTGQASGTEHMQWVQQDAANSYEARLAIEAKYGRILQGPIKVGGSDAGDFYKNW